jgi:LPS-assembly protein
MTDRVRQRFTSRRPLGPSSCLVPYAFLLLAPLAAPLAGPVRAAETLPSSQPWQISADKISRFVNPASVVAEGHVVMVRQGVASIGQLVKPGAPAPGSGPKPLTISGDWVRLDPVNNLVRVRGHAVLDSEEEHITAELVDLNMNRQTGYLQRATLYFPKRSLYLAGEMVEKTGDLTYHLEDGWVTRCNPGGGQAPPWSFSWLQGDITQEGFAHFSHTTFRIKDVPVAYTPYLAFSTGNTRKTGFLLPEWGGGSRDGVGILVPFFVNLSPSQDLTLYGGELSARGAQASVEYRYVQDAASKGTMEFSYLNDRLADSPGNDFLSDGLYRSNSDRYWLRGKADHDFGNNLSGKIDLDMVSDLDYLQEFSDGMIGYKESDALFTDEFGRGFEARSTYARPSTAQLTKLWPSMALEGEVRGINDTSAIPSTNHPWSLPSVDFAGSRPLLSAGNGWGPLGAPDLTWDSGYVYYWQEDGVGGQRLDLHPVIKAPIRLAPYLETTAAAGLRQTTYQVENNGSTQEDLGSGVLNRTLSDASLATSTVLMRDFDLNGSYLQKMTHIIRPGLAYVYVPAVSQADLPEIDSVDRILAQNQVIYSVRNDFDVVGKDGNSWKLAAARLSQGYDIHAARQDLAPDQERHLFTDIDFQSWLQPVPDFKLIYESSWGVYGEGAEKYNVGASYTTPRGDNLLTEYRYDTTQLQEINQINFNLTVRLATALRAQAVVKHSLAANETSDATLRLLYEPACWGVALQGTTTADNAYQVSLIFSLEGIGNITGFSQTMAAPPGWSGL